MNKIQVYVNMKWVCYRANGMFSRAIGYAFLNDNFIDSKDLAGFFLKYPNLDFNVFNSLIKQLNGNFAIIIEYKNTIFACVDKIRSYPLFYSLKNDTFVIGNDVHNIKNELGVDCIDSYAIKEFLTSGYVSQNRTLCDEIKQLQSGETLYFQANKKELNSIRTNRYYVYYETEKKHFPIDKMINDYNDILSKTFQRLIKSVERRRIVVPLSGGVDSRLVVSMLKKLGCKDVVCLSYGVPNNWETSISKKVAEKLGYDWIYVPYSRKKWHNAYRSREWKNYFYSQGNLSSLPNVSEWIAIGELKRNKSISENAVFVPGHTGDFISGGHLYYVFGEDSKERTKQNLIGAILKKHYGLWAAELKNSKIRNYLTSRLSDFFDSLPMNSEEDIASAYECWEWQERQSKFIINSVRTYDFWGYEWRLPLWDSEMMDFWSAVPCEMKMKKKLYLSHLKEKDEFGLFGVDLQRRSLTRRRIFSGKLRNFTEYFREITGVYGIYNYFTVSFLNKGRRNINSILVKDYIKEFQQYG